jgi:DNA polymerase
MSLPPIKILELLEMELVSLGREGIYYLPISRGSVDAFQKIATGGTKSIGLAMSTPVGEGSLSKASGPILLPTGSKMERYRWLRDQVLNCEECKKHVRSGKKIVFGTGSMDADIFFCGEAPGADEETIGEPFVGRAGQLLTKIISAMGLARENVYIANIMNWRPEMPTTTGNRPPTREEMNFCLPYLLAQIEIVQPKVIVALGATAAKGLLGDDNFGSMRDIRGKWSTFAHTPLMVTFHPSYLLRNNTNTTKRIVWEDMLSVMEKSGLPISEKQRKFFL